MEMMGEIEEHIELIGDDFLAKYNVMDILKKAKKEFPNALDEKYHMDCERWAEDVDDWFKEQFGD